MENWKVGRDGKSAFIPFYASVVAKSAFVTLKINTTFSSSEVIVQEVAR